MIVSPNRSRFAGLLAKSLTSIENPDEIEIMLSTSRRVVAAATIRPITPTRVWRCDQAPSAIRFRDETSVPRILLRAESRFHRTASHHGIVARIHLDIIPPNHTA